MNVNQYAANKLKELRTSKNMTQEELAEDLNITQQQVARYENNLRQFKQDFLFKLAEYFQVSINDFFPPIEGVTTDMLNDDMGEKYVNSTELAILCGTTEEEIRDITSGKEKLPKPSILIKIANALDEDPFTYLIAAGYVEDPECYENELYDSGIRFLLPNDERNILCEFLTTYWSKKNPKFTFQKEDVYKTLFKNPKENYTANEVKNLLESKNSLSEISSTTNQKTSKKLSEKIKNLLFEEIIVDDESIERIKDEIRRIAHLTLDEKNTIINMLEYYLHKNDK